jgi:hypothetical protein
MHEAGNKAPAHFRGESVQPFNAHAIRPQRQVGEACMHTKLCQGCHGKVRVMALD